MYHNFSQEEQRRHAQDQNVHATSWVSYLLRNPRIRWAVSYIQDMSHVECRQLSFPAS
jgi:hypothetical protein